MELRSILTETRVGELSLTNRPALNPADTIAVAAAEMRKTSHGCAVVCADDKVVGIITERDLMRLIHEGCNLDTVVSDVMTANPRTITIDDSLFEATRLMDEGGYRRIPVIDSNGQSRGVVDVKTITHFLVQHFPEAVYNQAARSQLIARHREGA